MNSEFSRLPGVDALLSTDLMQQLAGSCPHELLVSLTRQQLEIARKAITSGKECPTIENLAQSIAAHLERLVSPGLIPVINATGVVLHTNLGRAPLSQEAVAAMNTVAGDYGNLEFNLDTGNRGSRHVHIESLLCQISGAEAALVVNNNASAVLLALTALARRKEVIASRGEAVEIGGSFRIPDVMRQSGAKLVEVGTTNRTYIDDYEQAISPRTGALMRVHSSNFLVVGFTHSVTLEELTALAKRTDLPVVDDLGSGCLLDTAPFGLAPEPTVQESVSAGVGLALFSGDKLLGGPQAGIIVGRKELVDRLKKHPLARAVRIDKIRLAGLTATLVHYLKGEAVQKIPIWRMIATSQEEIGKRAEIWAKTLGSPARVIDGESMIGGGSLPGGTLPTRLVAIGGEGKLKSGLSVQSLADRLRKNKRRPVIGRINENVLLLDPRSVPPEQDELLLSVLKEIISV
ncbi:MAG: L-seryl-tRNA(Sec) selenium transferase [Dehalococcoidales bacterium]